MSRYRDPLPQLSGDLFLSDAGLETDLIFNRGVEIRGFAAHTLLPDAAGRAAMRCYLRAFLELARECDAGFILDSQTWKAHPHWAGSLEETDVDLRKANHDSIAFISELRGEFSGVADDTRPIVLNAVIGPRGDAYTLDAPSGPGEAEEYHSTQLGWLAETEVDMVTATTFTSADEAIGAVRAARRAGLPIVVSFTVETDGKLPAGASLDAAIRAVDDATEAGAEYFMVNCAHPEHFSHVFDDDSVKEGGWAHRLRGLRCNASRRSHAELDESETLDDGDPVEFGSQYQELLARLPWINVVGGCCGSDLRHVTEIARAIT